MPTSVAPTLVFNIQRNPPSLRTANVGCVDPSQPNGVNLNPVSIAALVAGTTKSFAFQIGDGVDALETLTGRTYRVGIGGMNAPVTGGTAVWGDGTVTVPVAQYWNASAPCIQAVLNALNAAAGPSGGNVVVSSPSAGAPYTVVWDLPGARSLLTVDVSNIYPSTVAIVQRSQTGTSTVREIQLVQLLQIPLAYSGSWSVSGTLASGVLIFNTPAVIQFLLQNPSGLTILEIEESDGTNIQKIAQLQVTLAGYVLAPSGSLTPGFPIQPFIVTTAIGPTDTVVTVAFGVTLPAVPAVWPVLSGNVNGTATLVPGSLTTTGCQFNINGPWGVSGSLQCFVLPL